MNQTLVVGNPQIIASMDQSCESIVSILTRLGVDASLDLMDRIYARQNPSREKRGGLGAGCFAFVTSIGSSKAQFININILANKASLSPFTLQIVDERSGRLSLIEKESGTERASAILVSPPVWYDLTLQSGRKITDIIQYHNTVNLVSIIGDTRCSLFDTNNPCSFCSMTGTGNTRTTDELIEALGIIIANDQARKMITFTSALFDAQGFERICEQLLRIKQTVGDRLTIALESQPLTDRQLESLYESGTVDTLMLPLDFVNKEVQQKHMPGKSALITDRYRSCLQKAVSLRGPGNVTSNIIVGIEDRDITKAAIDKMISLGVIPEPLVYRDNNSTGVVSAEGSLDTAVAYIAQNISLIPNRAKTKAGCPACGGCSKGFTANTSCKS